MICGVPARWLQAPKKRVAPDGRPAAHAVEVAQAVVVLGPGAHQPACDGPVASMAHSSKRAALLNFQ